MSSKAKVMGKTNPNWRQKIVSSINHCSLLPGTNQKVCSVTVRSPDENNRLGIGFISFDSSIDEKKITKEFAIAQCDPEDTFCSVEEAFLKGLMQ